MCLAAIVAVNTAGGCEQMAQACDIASSPLIYKKECQAHVSSTGMGECVPDFQPRLTDCRNRSLKSR
jgi:hypothetical protein